jgi:sugar O-acyltransferase (sialic acid O-acetyltransferase NeuD family)
MNIAIVGAGGHGQVVADILRARRLAGGDVRVVGYVDDRRMLHGKAFLDIRVLGPVNMLASLDIDGVIVAIGDNAARARLSRALEEAGLKLGTAIHPTAIVGSDVMVGEGSMISAGAIVTTGTLLGRGVILNTGCTVDHHTVLGDFVHIAPGVHMGGEVRIGEGALVGIGAVVLPRVAIAVRATVGAGAVVTRDVPEGVTVVGNPARPLQRRIQRRA